MRELDQPTTEGGCGMDSPVSPPPLSAVPPKPDVPPPSMSVNINAQGMQNIEDMMKLFTKVNPDMMPKIPEPMPTLSIMPGMGMDKPMGPPDIKPINKLLPDFDADNDDKIGGEKDHMEPDGDEGPEPKMSSDDDGDEEDKKKSKDEEYANEPDTDIKDVDYMNNKLAGGMNRPKDTFPKVSDGDNPMKKSRFESGDLRAQIRAELLQRLSEAKGAK